MEPLQFSVLDPRYHLVRCL